MTTAKDVFEKKTDLDQYLVDLRQSYLDKNTTIQTENNAGKDLSSQANIIRRKINAAEAEHFEVLPEWVANERALIQQASIHFNNSTQAELERDRINIQISEAEISLKNWSAIVTIDDVRDSNTEQNTIAEQISKVIAVISEVQNKDFSGSTTLLEELKAGHSQLMAKVALGEAEQVELDTLNVQINETEALVVTDRKAQSEQAGTLNGLNDRLDSLRAIEQQKGIEHEHLKRSYLMTKAEKTARQYIAATNKAAKLSAELTGFCELLGIKPSREEVKLNGFGLKSFEGAGFSVEYGGSTQTQVEKELELIKYL